MLWVIRRETKREEDMAYLMLGIFDIYISLIYSEGRKNALKRLQKEIQKSAMNQLKLRPKPSLNMLFNRDPDFVDRPSILAQLSDMCVA